jgi:hypothetical protein
MNVPITVTARSEAWVCGRWLARIAGLNSALGMGVCCKSCVLSGRGLCFGLITLPEESYRVWCLWVWSWSLDTEESVVHSGLLRRRRKNTYVWFMIKWLSVYACRHWQEHVITLCLICDLNHQTAMPYTYRHIYGKWKEWEQNKRETRVSEKKILQETSYYIFKEPLH